MPATGCKPGKGRGASPAAPCKVCSGLAPVQRNLRSRAVPRTTWLSLCPRASRALGRSQEGSSRHALGRENTWRDVDCTPRDTGVAGLLRHDTRENRHLQPSGLTRLQGDCWGSNPDSHEALRATRTDDPRWPVPRTSSGVEAPRASPRCWGRPPSKGEQTSRPDASVTLVQRAWGKRGLPNGFPNLHECEARGQVVHERA